MASDIPTQFKFEDLLHHTFPGFITAITLFMLITIWSPKDLTTWAFNSNAANLVGFFGFIVLAGTILGVLIDGIHHLIIQGSIFNNFGKIKDIFRFIEFLYPEKERKLEIDLTRHYFFSAIGDKALNIDEYLINSKHRYSEFYANTFIALVPFSLVVPFYLVRVLKISPLLSVVIALISLSLACICWKSSYNIYKEYLKAIYSFLRGCLEEKNKNEPPKEKSPCEEVSICAGILNIIPVIIIDIVAFKIFGLNWWVLISIFIFGLIFVSFIYCIWKIQYYQKQDYFKPDNPKDENRPKLDELLKIISKNAFGLTLTLLFMIFVLLFYSLYYYMPS